MLTDFAPVLRDDLVEATDLKTRMEEYERSIIENALADASFNQRRAALRLGVLATTLNEKMKRLGIPGRRSVRTG